MIGVDTPESDAELIAICAEFFKRLGLSPQKVQIYVNDRRLTNQLLADLGVPEDMRPKALHLIDRRDKLSPEVWEAYALEIGLSAAQLEGLKVDIG